MSPGWHEEANKEWPTFITIKLNQLTKTSKIQIKLVTDPNLWQCILQ